LGFTATAGVEYQFAVDVAPAAVGSFTLRLAPPPGNDAFADRTLLVGTNATSASCTLHASVETQEWAGDGAGSSVWWTWAAPADGLARLTVQTAESSMHTLAVFAEMAGSGESNVFAEGARSTTNRVAGSFPAMAGRVYDVRVGALRGDSTRVVLALEFESGPGARADWMAGGGDWLLGGSAGWFVQNAVVRSGPDALQSGAIPAPSGWGMGWLVEPVETWVQATFPGPGTVESWWRVSTAVKDGGVFSRLTDPPAILPAGWRLSGVTDWTRVNVDLPRRANVVRWTYSRTSTQGTGTNAAWLDDVRFVPRAPQPIGLGFAPVEVPPGVLIRFTAEAQRCLLSSRRRISAIGPWLPTWPISAPAPGH
jgi:hypothetical protein